MFNEEVYDLTCWYLNLRRIIELTGSQFTSRRLNPASLGDKWEQYPHLKFAILGAAKDMLLDWLQVNDILPLNSLLQSDKTISGNLFTYYTRFYCYGVMKHWPSNIRQKKPTQLPYIHTDISSGNEKIRLKIPFHPEHLTGNSAWTMLSGSGEFFVLALAKTVDEQKIEAIPYVIVSPILAFGNTYTKTDDTMDKIFDSSNSFMNEFISNVQDFVDTNNLIAAVEVADRIKEIEQDKQLLKVHKQRKFLLEKHSAIKGVIVDPSVLIEIADIQQKINEIKSRIACKFNIKL